MITRWIVAMLLLLGAAAFAVPALPSAPLYTAPGYQEVLSGKAPLRIRVISHMPMLAWTNDGEVRALNAADKSLLDASKPAEVTGLARSTEDGNCWLRKNRQNVTKVNAPFRLESSLPIKLWTSMPDTWQTFPSPLYITPLPDGTFSVARAIMLEDYLRYVVAGEMPATFHPEALKAQAIIARTYTLCYLGRHADEGADLCAGVHCQVFGQQRKP
ncbi:MAG TPA: SpoIID/LytB domain-containing protein, partial [Armatimonadota bacterium]